MGLLQDMATSQVVKSVITYTAAMSVFSKGHQWQLALALLAKIPRAQVHRNAATHSAAISALEKAQYWQSVPELLKEAESVLLNLQWCPRRS